MGRKGGAPLPWARHQSPAAQTKGGLEQEHPHPTAQPSEVKLISLLLKIWEGGMLQLLGKAQGSQDLLNPNPLRHQVCLNSSKSYFIIQAQQWRKRGVVAGSP